MNLINNISEALTNELILNPATQAKEICLKNYYSTGEPVKTLYGRGYILEGNSNNTNFKNILKVKLKMGEGYLK